MQLISRSGQRSVFVGRSLEFSALTEAFNSMLDGSGATVVVSGDAGMGKTTLVEHFAESARKRGAQVHWGRAHEHAGAPPLWPWVQIFRSLSESGVIDKELVGSSGADPTDLAGLIPDEDGSTGVDESVSSADSTAQFRLFDSVTSVLRAVSQNTPLVIAIDNLHWADTSSLKLLEFVSHELQSSQVLIIGTYREAESRRGSALSESIAELARTPGFSDVRMSPLSRDDIRQLVLGFGGAAPPEALVDAVHSHSEGSPFFAHNAIQLLGNRGKLNEQAFADTADWDIGIPAGVKDIIGRRIDDLSEDCVLVLRSAAVVGREFDLQVLVSLFPESDEDQLLERLDEAISAGIINESQVAADRFIFDHDLFRQTLESDLRLSRRVRLHSRIAASMDELFGTSDTNYAARIAYHYRQADSVADAELVAAACIRAGRVASNAYAYDEAADHFGAAVEILEDTAEEQALLARALDGRARALFALGRIPEAFEPTRRAFEKYLDVGMATQALDILSVPLPQYGREGMTKLLERGIEVATSDTETFSLLLSRLGAARAHELWEFGIAEQAFQDAIAAARAAGSKRAESWAYGRWAMVSPMDWRKVQELSEKALDVMPPGQDFELEVHCRIWLGEAFYHQGDIDGGLREFRRSEEIAIKARNPMRAAQASMELALLMRLQGRWDECLAREDALGFKLWDRPFGSHMAQAQIYFTTGQTDPAKAAYARARALAKSRVSGVDQQSDPAWSNSWQSDISGLLGITGDASFIDDVPAGELWSTIPEDVANHPALAQRTDLLTRVSVAGIIAIVRNDTETSKIALDLLRQYDYPVGLLRLNQGGSTDRFHGRLAVTAGMPDEALGHFESAHKFCSENGLVYDHAWTCHDLAKLLIDERWDIPRALTLIGEGVQIAERYEIRPLVDQLTSLRSNVPGKATQHPDGLTDREVEVLKELAVGKSNREIAEALFISQNTVIRHVANIFSKTGSANRAQAAVYATGHDLQ